MPSALITGITGQDGSYLAEHLLSQGYLVIGMIRRQSSPTLRNINSFAEDERFILISGDMTDPVSLRTAVKLYKPDEIYNLAAMSFVATSWRQPELTQAVNFLGFLHLLEAVRDLDESEKRRTRIYQASTSEMFGNVPPPQAEDDAMQPHSPYGVAKLASHALAKVYRDSYKMHISCGILFNHESPRRGIEFVTRKIARGVARIASGLQETLALGNLESKRDFGSAKDYVRAMHLIMQYDEPDDFVIGTGESHSIREYLDCAFGYAGIDNWSELVTRDPRFYRPVDIKDLRADSSKAQEILGWKHETTFEELVHWMVDAEMSRLDKNPLYPD